MRFGFLVVGIVLVLTSSLAAQTGDEAAIRAQVAAMETALNERDSEGYASVYLPDGDFINTVFARSSGREAIREELDRLFAALGPPDVSEISITVTTIRFLGADVAIVDGDVLPTQGRATYVMARRDGTWRVAAGRILPAMEQ